jgi:aerobic C4-dicarboxylate transport protein
MQLLGDRSRPVFVLIESAQQILFRLIGLIMRLAPIGAFGAMAFTIGKYGIGTVLVLGEFMVSFYTTCLIFIFVVLGAISWAAGFSILSFIKYLREELLLVFGFSSSEPVLPRFMAKMENLGCSESVVGLVIPTGYSFNLDGTCIYLTMAALFLAQATNTELSIWQQLGILAILLLTSKGATAVTGSGFIVLSATLGSVSHIPIAAIALIFGIDRFMSEARALTNFLGTGVATIVVAKWEGELDEARLQATLRNETLEQADDPEKLLIRAS